jgi:hypothetical protein
VLVGKTNNFDFTLEPGVQTANVTVTAGDVDMVSREKTDISMNITPRDVQDLPLNGRDLGNLAYLAPEQSLSTPTIQLNVASLCLVSMVRAVATST